MNLPGISIVVPSFNQGQYLEETLLSIITQEYPNLELFVVDGGSRDNSVDIIKKYAGQITWWISEKDSGQSEAINKGFTKASGEIISWLCSDDLYTPGTLHKVAEYFTAAPGDTGLVHGGTALFRGQEEVRTDWGYPEPMLERNLAGMAFSQPSAFFRKKYLDMIGGRVNESLHYGMDYDLYCRLACVCRFLPVPDIFSRYRLHQQSKSLAEQDRFIDDWHRTFVNLCKNLDWHDQLRELELSGMIEKEILSWYQPFSFQPEQQMLNRADKKKILFYTYCYTLRAWYKSGLFKKAGRLARMIRDNYPENWWQEEKGIATIMSRVFYPPVLIRLARKLKSSL